MSKSEDYLDDLLNSVSDTNKRNNKRDIENLINSMNQEVSKPKGHEKKSQPKPRADFGEKFVREFEQEIALGTADDFLNDFEMELDEEEAASQGDIETETEEAHTDFIQNVSGIIDEAKRKLENPEDGEPALYSGDGLTDFGGSSLLNEASEGENLSYVNTLDENLENDNSSVDESALNVDEFFAKDQLPEQPVLPDGIDLSEEPVLIDEDNQDTVNLMDMISGDDELTDIGDMLQLDEAGMDENADLDLGGEGIETSPEEAESLDDEEDLQDEFERLGSIEGLEELTEAKGKKGKKGKRNRGEKKPGFFTKLMALLFGEDEDDFSNVKVAEEDAVGAISDENLEILKELDASKAGNGKKEKKKKEKKEKKEQKPKKEKPAKVKKPKEVDNTPPLPKKPVILIFIMAISIFALILLGSNNIQYAQDVGTAKTEYANGEYIKAYESIAGMSVKKRDQSLYDKAKIMANVQQEYDAYLTMMDLKEYELALDALVRGIGRCDNFADDVAALEATGELELARGQLVQGLSDSFGVTVDQARELYALHKRKDYTKALQEILKNLDLE